MPHTSSVVKSVKELVDSLTNSSSEKSQLTTTFTDNTSTVSEKVVQASNGILDTIMNIIKHPKFKWILVTIILCTLILFYFKSQNKQDKPKDKSKKEPIKEKLTQDNHMPSEKEIHALLEKELKDKLIREQMLQAHLNQHQHQHQPQHKPPQKSQPPPPPQEESDSDSSEEVFIEDENVMNHNLTMDEMNAIDMQLEDVNLDNLSYKDDN